MVVISLSNSLFRGSILNPKIYVITIGVVCGNRYSEFGFEWGLPSSRSSPDLSNPRKITTIGARTRRHAPVRAPVRKLHAPPRAAVPTVSETHSSGHRIEQWIPPSGSSSPDLKNSVKNGLIGAATRRWKLRRPPPPSTCQRMPSTRQRTPGTRLARAWPATSASPIRTQTGSELIRDWNRADLTGPSRFEPDQTQTGPGPAAKKKKKKKKRKLQKNTEFPGEFREASLHS
jgi:hypothetical protein